MSSIINATTTAGVTVTGDNSGSLQLATNNGTTAVTIDTSQNVGIGSTSPVSLLEVKDASPVLTINQTDTSTTCRLAFYGYNRNYETTAINTTEGGTAGAGNLVFFTNPGGSGNSTERMRITSGGQVLVGTTTTPSSSAQGIVNVNSGGGFIQLGFNNSNGGGSIGAVSGGGLGFYGYTGAVGSETYSERMRIDSSGRVLVGTTATNLCAGDTVGIGLNTTIDGTYAIGAAQFSASGNPALNVNRKADDGNLVTFSQAGTQEGTISVSGTTVSYNGGHLSRWSQLLDNSKDDTILKGTVLSNLDDMCVWAKDGETLPNEQLNKMKVSDVEGDTNVAGVFVNWTRDEDCNSDDMNIAMTGDMIIRIAEGVVVQKGDLLMSAGNGTAKPQGDDIRRSKTVAKVTSNHVTCTYADGSYCVPCVLMAC